MNVKFSAKCVAVIAAGAMSMSLAACSGGSMDGSSSSNGSAANGDTITLGSITTNSGTAAAYGEAEVAGFKLAVDEINALGGDIQFELRYEDDVHDPEKAVNAYNILKAGACRSPWAPSPPSPASAPPPWPLRTASLP